MKMKKNRDIATLLAMNSLYGKVKPQESIVSTSTVENFKSHAFWWDLFIEERLTFNDPVDKARFECGLPLQGKSVVVKMRLMSQYGTVGRDFKTVCYVCERPVTHEKPAYWNAILNRPIHKTCKDIDKLDRCLCGRPTQTKRHYLLLRSRRYCPLSSLYGSHVVPGSAAIHEIDKVSSYPAVIQRGDK